MEKPAPADHPIHELLSRRWSPRVFSPKPIDPAHLLSMFEAARWAPSCSNEQSWRFVFATKDNAEAFDRLAACLNEGNFVWAKTAPVIMFTIARKTFERNGLPNRHAMHDVGQAIADLTIQAMSLGIFVHQMAGYDIGKAHEALGLTDEFEPVAAVVLGYAPDSDMALPEDIQNREHAPRIRKALREIVFEGRFGEPSQLE